MMQVIDKSTTYFEKKPDGFTHYFSIDSGWNWVEDRNGNVVKSWKM